MPKFIRCLGRIGGGKDSVEIAIDREMRGYLAREWDDRTRLTFAGGLSIIVEAALDDLVDRMELEQSPYAYMYPIGEVPQYPLGENPEEKS